MANSGPAPVFFVDVSVIYYAGAGERTVVTDYGVVENKKN